MRPGLPRLAALSWLSVAAAAKRPCKSAICPDLKRSIETKESDLARRGMMAILGAKSRRDYADMKIDHFGTLRSIEGLKARFFDALAGTGLYPRLGEKAKAEILAMSPEDFRACFEEKYRSDRRVKNTAFYVEKFMECPDKIRRLESEIAEEEAENRRCGDAERRRCRTVC